MRTSTAWAPSTCQKKILKLSKLQVQQPQLYAACAHRYLPFAAADSARNLSNMVFALCKAPRSIRNLEHQAALQQELVQAFVAKCAEANAQDISNVLYSMAASGQQMPEETVQQLLAAFASQLRQATPQNVSNALWAVAALGQQALSAQVQQLLNAFVGQSHQATPQSVSNALWAVATMGQQVPPIQLQQLLYVFGAKLKQAKPQDVQNTLWAVAQFGHQV
jgi:hypothetical protein